MWEISYPPANQIKSKPKKEKKNYRPVSCLAAASKVLEKVVCDQLTMTALSEIQREWIENTERNEVTGVLFWDLSAAFDTLNPDLFCKKFKIYGGDQMTCNWYVVDLYLTLCTRPTI